MKAKKSVANKPRAERLAEVKRTIAAHPGVTIDQLAAMLHVHRSTAYAFARDIATARKSQDDPHGAHGWFVKGAQKAQGAKAAKPTRVAPLPAEERLAALRLFLAKHPGATTAELSAAIGVSKNRLLTLAHRIAKISGAKPGTGNPATWTLKNDHRKAKTNGTAYAAVNGNPKKRHKSSLAMKRYWANMPEHERRARRAKMGASISRTAALKRQETAPPSTESQPTS